MTLFRKKITDTTVICLIAALVMFVALFLPYASARDEFREMIRAEGGDICFEGTDVKLEKISMIDFLKVYASRPEGAAVGQYCGWLVGIMGLGALLSGMFSLLKKPVAMLFTNVTAFAAFYLHNSSYSGRNLIPSWEYRFGIAYYLFAVAAIVCVAGGIWMLRDKKKDPATEQSEQNPQ